MEQINKEKFDELLKGEKPVVCAFYEVRLYDFAARTL